MAIMEHASDENLKSLRNQFASHVSILLLVTAVGLVAWLVFQHQAPPLASVGLAALLALLGLGAFRLVESRPVLGQHLLVWCLTGGLLIAIAARAAPWLATLGLPLILLNGLLFSGAELLTAGAMAGLVS